MGRVMRAVISCVTMLLASVSAQAEIIRCTGTDGGDVYTDRSCESMGLASKLPALLVQPDEAMLATGYAPRELGVGCAARSPEAMRNAVHGAIERRDLNALTGLYNFNGSSSRSATPVVRRLDRLTRRAALEIELVNPEAQSLFDVVMPDPDAMPSLRIVQHAVGNDGPTRIENFQLSRAAGCIWLR